MSTKRLLLGGVLLGSAAVGVVSMTRRGIGWGSTSSEREASMPGDRYLAGGPAARTVMTRAISIAVAPEVAWPWLAQMGRGAGWYSYDRLDNGGARSASHVVSWIPEPSIGDAAAIGWLRDMVPGRGMTWYLAGHRSGGMTMRMVVDIRLTAEDRGSRLVIRMSGDAVGRGARAFVHGFEVVDSIMGVRQLKGIKARAETYGVRTADPDEPETGSRDQYQLYETIWASGERAGVAGWESAAQHRDAAIAAGALTSLAG